VLPVPPDRRPDSNPDGRSAQRPLEAPARTPTKDLPDLVAQVADSTASRSDRRRQLAALTKALAASARSAGLRAMTAGRWLADVLAESAPRIPVRGKAVLRGHHPGKSDDEIADALIRNAMLATAALGGAAGALAAAEFAAPPTLLAAPVQLAAETLAIAAIEIKLVAELHELYEEPALGTLGERGTTYLMSWVRQRAIEPAVAGAGLAALLGQAAKRELRTRLVRRMGRSGFSLVPFLAGALAGAEVNRRTTRALGEAVARDLHARR
jgi:hypothetical protein